MCKLVSTFRELFINVDILERPLCRLLHVMALDDPPMARPLPIYGIMVLLLLLAAGGLTGAARLLPEGQFVHSIPSVTVGALAAVSAVALMSGRWWARSLGMFGCFLAGVVGLTVMTYFITQVGFVALLEFPQIAITTVACLLVSVWLRYSRAAERYFDRA
jgi:hypothetical protein